MRGKMWIVTLIALGPAAGEAGAQVILGARFISMGQAATALPQSVWSVFANPAMLDGKTGTASFFGIRYYGFPELTDMAAVVTQPVKTGVLGMGFHRYGYDLFSKNRFRIVYKNGIEDFNYGAVLNYSYIMQGGGYGSAGALGIDLGVAAIVTDGVWFGARATNVNQPDYGKTGEQLPRELVVGFSCRLSPTALFISEVVKDVRFPLSYRGGAEITFLGSLFGRAGITTQPVTFSGGLGYRLYSWQINLAVQNHQDLGLSPGMDLTVRW